MKNIKSYALVAVLALGLTACGGSNKTQNGSSDMGSSTQASEVKTGTAEVENGYGGPIKVIVTMEGDKITKIERETKETDNVGEVAMDELTKKMIEENKTDVESVSGATVSSDAFKKAVEEAVKNAK